MDRELTAEEFIEEWKLLLGDDDNEYDTFKECIREMGKCGVKFYLADGVPIIDATAYSDEVKKLNQLFEL